MATMALSHDWRCLACHTEWYDPTDRQPCPSCGNDEGHLLEAVQEATPAVKAAQAVMQPKAQSAPKGAAKAPAVGNAPGETRMAHIVAMLLWCGAWALNGVATILPIALLGRSIGQLGLFIGLGIAAHIIVTLIENHLWRSFGRCYPGEKVLIGLEIFAVGLIDVVSATLMFLYAALWLGIASYTWPWYTVCTLIAVAVAIGSEPMIRFHRKLLRR